MSTARAIILTAFREACARVDLRGRVERALGDDGPFVVIAVGKAAAAMADGVHQVSDALVVVDVPHGGAHDVGSGPSIEAPTTIEDARAVAARYGLGDLPWIETWKHSERHDTLASPATFAESMAAAIPLRARVSIAPDTDVESLARSYLDRAARMSPGE